MPHCKICKTDFASFIDFGPMPIANAFLPSGEDDGYRFSMQVGFCPECYMVQLVEQPEPERMFHENYAYFSSISTVMQDHFEQFGSDVRGKLQGKDPFVVEVGSNDGIMLRHFADAGIRHLGIEPSSNVAEAARQRGVNTLCAFFDQDVGRRIRKEYGPVDAVIAANVFCHIPTMPAVIEGFAEMLSDEGVVVFEDPYLGDIVNKTSFDQIYDEHVFYYSVLSVSEMFSRHGFELVDVEPQDVHGGSMRYTLVRKGCRQPSSAVARYRKLERDLKLDVSATYGSFGSKVEAIGRDLTAQLTKFKAEGKRVAGYGATSKSTTVIHSFGLTPDLVEYISDTTPSKHDTLSPGGRIPVVPYERFQADPPDVALLFAWNHAKEIMAKEEAFTRAGGQWLLYVPEVRLLP